MDTFQKKVLKASLFLPKVSAQGYQHQPHCYKVKTVYTKPGSLQYT